MTTTPAMQVVSEVMELAQTATSFADAQLVAVRSLSRWLPCESAFWGNARLDSCQFIAQDDTTYRALERMSAAPTRYAHSNRHEQIRRLGGVAADADIFSSVERERLPLFAEILRPVGIRTHLVCQIAFRGQPMSLLAMARQERGAPFGAGDRALLQSVRGALGIVEAAWSATSFASVMDVVRGILSPREAQVATLVARGLQNKEIAVALGTSPETVRKQTIRIYAKTGARGRVELTAFLGRPGVDSA